MALNRRRPPANDEPPSWGEIALAIICSLAFIAFIIMLDGGSL